MLIDVGVLVINGDVWLVIFYYVGINFKVFLCRFVNPIIYTRV